MRRPAAAVGSAVFFVVAPGVVAGLVPWLISGWRIPGPMSPLAIIRITTGSVLLVAGVVVLVRAFARFVAEGGGTPGPVAPTERFVRNPMYLAVVAAVLGQAMIFGSLALLMYALTVWAIFAAFVRWYEEPLLLKRYGDDYQRYRQAVRAWVPRLHPWHVDADHASNSV